MIEVENAQLMDSTKCRRCGDLPGRRGAVRVSRLVVETAPGTWLATFECELCAEPYFAEVAVEVAQAMRMPIVARHDLREVKLTTVATWSKIKAENRL